MRERGRESKGREGERALYRGSEGSASAWFGGGIIIAQCVSAGVAFSTKVSTWTWTGHEADGTGRVILVTRYTNTRYILTLAGEASSSSVSPNPIHTHPRHARSVRLDSAHGSEAGCRPQPVRSSSLAWAIWVRLSGRGSHRERKRRRRHPVR